MVTRILIIGAFGSLNKGDEARVRVAVDTIRAADPNVSFAFWSTHPDIDGSVFADIGVTIESRYKYAHKTNVSWLANSLKMAELFGVLTGAFVSRIIGKNMYTSAQDTGLCSYDMFLDISGESLSDYYGFLNLVRCLYAIYLGIVLKKKTVIFAETIGPYASKLSRALARHVLNRVDLITVRDSTSLQYLAQYGINRPLIYLTADPGFLLESISGAELDAILEAESINDIERPKLLGMSISRGSYRHALSETRNLVPVVDRFFETTGHFVDYAVEHLGFHVVFIPHAVSIGEDDRHVFEEIRRHVQRKRQFQLVSGDYDSRETKGLIGNCDVFIGSRMHANIAALSSLLPTLAIAYSHKMPSLMKRLGQEDHVCQVEEVTLERLVAEVNKLWKDRKTIRQDLKPKVDELKESARLNAKLVSSLIRSD